MRWYVQVAVLVLCCVIVVPANVASMYHVQICSTSEQNKVSRAVIVTSEHTGHMNDFSWMTDYDLNTYEHEHYMVSHMPNHVYVASHGSDGYSITLEDEEWLSGYPALWNNEDSYRAVTAILPNSEERTQFALPGSIIEYSACHAGEEEGDGDFGSIYTELGASNFIGFVGTQQAGHLEKFDEWFWDYLLDEEYTVENAVEDAEYQVENQPWPFHDWEVDPVIHDDWYYTNPEETEYRPGRYIRPMKTETESLDYGYVLNGDGDSVTLELDNYGYKWGQHGLSDYVTYIAIKGTWDPDYGQEHDHVRVQLEIDVENINNRGDWHMDEPYDSTDGDDSWYILHREQIHDWDTGDPRPGYECGSSNLVYQIPNYMTFPDGKIRVKLTRGDYGMPFTIEKFDIFLYLGEQGHNTQVPP